MPEKRIHPIVLEEREELRKGKISRRDFLRVCTLLGLSLGQATLLAGCAPQEATETAPSIGPTTGPQPTAVPQPSATPAGMPVRGGTLMAARRLDRCDHPARFALVNQAHPWSHVLEPLASTAPGGALEPRLAESWEASDDLLTWTFHLRRGVTFNNGNAFTADDVVASIQDWLNVDVGSSIKDQMSYLSPEGIEKVDDYTVALHIDVPTIMVAYEASGSMLPRGFGGDITLEPVGTGPFTMEEYAVSERARLVRRQDYYRNGVDGQPLPYLDGITFLQLGEGREPELAALQTGEVDTVPEPTVEMWETLKDDDRFEITSLPTAATRLLRVRCDQEPWTDNRVRSALKYCHNREKILAVALRNQGTIGNDSHVAPVHLDCSGEVEPLPFDTERARALLSEAGYPDGISFDLIFASSWGETMAYAQALKEDALAGGFDIRLNPMPDGQFWDGWLDWNASITWWAHAPLCETDLVSAYTVDSEGQPAVWNESRWIDPEFCTLLDEACRTLDLAARKRIVAQLERIQRDRGSIATPFFMNVWAIVNKRVHGVRALESELADYYVAWKEPEA